MTAFERAMLVNALIERLPVSPGLVAIYREDVERIEPLIDEMIRQAEMRARVQGYLEELHRLSLRMALTLSPDRG